MVVLKPNHQRHRKINEHNSPPQYQVVFSEDRDLRLGWTSPRVLSMGKRDTKSHSLAGQQIKIKERESQINVLLQANHDQHSFSPPPSLMLSWYRDLR